MRQLQNEGLNTLFFAFSPSFYFSMDGAQRPQFIKVLSQGCHLSIPSAFVKHIIDDNHGNATIFSLGKFWQVKVQQDEEHLFFGDGWTELAAAHGLDEGFFLVFHYEGNMVFTLKIFDQSGCRKYDTAKKRKARTADEDTDSALNNDCGRPMKSINVEKSKLPDVHRGNTQSMELKKKKKKKIHMSSFAENQSEFIKVNEELQFSKTICKNDLVYSHLYVPFSFCASNGFTTTQDVILRDSKGKSFPVNLLSYPGRSPRFSKGWRLFSEEKNLKEGDTCVFEVDSENKNILHVRIKYKP